MQNLHRPVSNRGQWRDALAIYTNNVPDPSQSVFAFTAWPTDCGHVERDYGWRHSWSGRGGLFASGDDNTGRLVAAVSEKSIIVAWLFPAREMQALSPGSYEASISAMIGDELAEIEAFKFVIQARGGPRLSRLPAIPAPLPSPTAILTPEAVAALLPLLPTSLPAQPNLPWNNGGFLSWS